MYTQRTQDTLLESVLLMTSTYSRFLDVDEIKKSWEVPKFYVNVVSIKEQNVDLCSTCLQSSDVNIYQHTLQVRMAICLV